MFMRAARKAGQQPPGKPHDQHEGKPFDPKVNVLLSCGYALNDQAEDILKRGGRGFIQKPFTIEQLLQKIREVLSSSSLTTDYTDAADKAGGPY